MLKLILCELLQRSVAQQWVDPEVPNTDGVATSVHELEQALLMYVEPNTDATTFYFK